MTKKQLIEMLKEYPDDTLITIIDSEERAIECCGVMGFESVEDIPDYLRECTEYGVLLC